MLPEEVTRFIGQTEDTVILRIEAGAIQRFADAVGDANPLFADEEYARNSRYGTIIALPGFFGWPAKPTKEALTSSALKGALLAALSGAGYSRLLDGGMEYEFFGPIRAGDTLAASSRIRDIMERGGQAFVFTETTYTNQNGDMVAKARSISSSAADHPSEKKSG